MVLAALRDVRGGGAKEEGNAESGTAAAAAALDGSAEAAAEAAAPLSFSSLTPRQKEAALQLLFSRLRNVVFVPGRSGRRSSGGGRGGGE